MQCNCCPNFLDIRIVDLEFAKMLTGGIGAADFETLRSVMFICTSHVVEKTRGKDEGKTLWVCPGGVRPLRESFRVDVDSETMIEDSGWKASLDEVVGACAHGRRWDYLGLVDCRDVSDGLGCVQVERRWWAHDEQRCIPFECAYHLKGRIRMIR